MKLKSKLLMFTAAVALSANVAMAAINAQTLADAYLADGYSYVEIKVGPTQTKLEGLKGDRKVEVIYDNATGAIIKQEFEDADDDYVGRTGSEIEDSGRDFTGGGDDDGDDADDDAGDDDNQDDGDDDHGGDDDDDHGSDDDDDQGDDDQGDDDDGDDDQSDDHSDDKDGDDNDGDDKDGDD